jgi:hypothetical protein
MSSLLIMCPVLIEGSGVPTKYLVDSPFHIQLLSVLCHIVQELLEAFPEDQWEWIFLLQTRFDLTPAYGALEKPPLAWWGLLKRL